MKILIATTTAYMIRQFCMNDLQLLHLKDSKLYVACNFGKINPMTEDVINEFKEDLNKMGCFYENVDIPRSPFSLNIFRAYFQLKKLIKENHFDLIHCHTPVGGALTRLAAIGARRKGTKVIYTAHGFHFFKGAPLLNWLLYYPAEKICSYFTDALITINQEDYALAQAKMKAKKIYYIPGVGVDSEKFAKVQVDHVAKRAELGIPADAKLLLSVGELNKNKNHEVILRAMAELKQDNLYYVIAGNGPLKEYLQDLAQKLGLANHFKLLGYRRDIGELCKTADVFCFPSLREGLGLSSLEAMSVGLPLITSNVHGIVDYSKNDETGINTHPLNINGFAKAIETLANNKDLRLKMGKYNTQKVKEFDLKVVQEKMEKIYNEVING